MFSWSFKTPFASNNQLTNQVLLNEIVIVRDGKGHGWESLQQEEKGLSKSKNKLKKSIHPPIDKVIVMTWTN